MIWAATRQRRIDAGCCVVCGELRKEGHASLCATCAVRHNEQCKARRERQMADGMCGRCCCRPRQDASVLCEGCDTKTKEAAAARVASGQCRQCGKKREQYRALCDSCAAINRDRSRAALRRKNGIPIDAHVRSRPTGPRQDLTPQQRVERDRRGDKEHKLALLARGLCQRCQKPREQYARFCDVCAAKCREAVRTHARRKRGIPIDAPVRHCGPKGPRKKAS